MGTVLRHGDSLILYDPEAAEGAPGAWFEAARHGARDASQQSAEGGRGPVRFFHAGGRDLALRRYRRGGLPAQLGVVDRYLWRGLEQTRAWREWRLTRRLFAQGLPLPRPVAARVVRSGLFYRAELLTERIADVVTLADRLLDGGCSLADWREIGRVVRRFHDQGLHHPDINVRNILLRADGAAFLIDFDRCALRRRGGGWQQRNLARLQRSLRKMSATAFDPVCGEGWPALLEGYRG